MHTKVMTNSEFTQIIRLDWIPVTFIDERTLPAWIKEIPKTQRSYVYASGSNVRTELDSYGRTIVGGIDIFRPAESHPEHVKFNKDHYIVIKRDDNNLLIVEYDLRSIKDPEHHTNSIPDRLNRAIVLTYSK